MIKMRAVKSFLGKPGESNHPDGMVRRGTIVTVATESRARDLRRMKLAEDETARHTAKDWPKAGEEKKDGKAGGDATPGEEQGAKQKPARRTKKKPDPENKGDAGPLDGKEDGATGTPTGGAAKPSSSPAEAAPATSAENSGGLPLGNPTSGS